MENRMKIFDTKVQYLKYKVLREVDRVKPEVVIVDSVQTMYSPLSSSSPGSVTQVREAALSFIAKAKNENISVILVGHVNKEGSIAGPKLLEHMVDAVLCFEGDHQQAYRIIRAGKNRYGSTNEIGVFEMTDKGLCQVPNPSEVLLAGRPKKVSGNCAVCTLEGTRPIIAEVQALVSPTAFPSPRRTVNGLDYNRICLITAVLEKRLGLRFSANDIYLNVIGGLHLDEPAADIAIALAMISSITDKIVPDDLVAIGEIGLAGECRAVSSLEQRVREAERLGFTRVVVPFRNIEKRPIESSAKLLPVKSVYEVLMLLADEEIGGMEVCVQQNLCLAHVQLPHLMPFQNDSGIQNQASDVVGIFRIQLEANFVRIHTFAAVKADKRPVIKEFPHFAVGKPDLQLAEYFRIQIIVGRVEVHSCQIVSQLLSGKRNCQTAASLSFALGGEIGEELRARAAFGQMTDFLHQKAIFV